MKFTKEDRLEMLNEMWEETNVEFTIQMANKNFDEALKLQNKLNLITQLQKFITN